MNIDSGFCRFLPVLLLLTIIVPAGAHALDVKGRIDTDTNWTIDDNPIRVTGDLLVAQGATLTINPGVEVIFQPRADTTRGFILSVEGALAARGEATLPIMFTAQDINRPWGAIIFRDTSVDWNAAQSTGSILSYCVIQYGGNESDLGAMIVTQNAMPLIADNAIRFSRAAGIAAFADDAAVSPSGDIQIIDNQVYNNPTGLLLDAEGGVVAGNYFLNNNSALNITTRSRGIDLRDNTITGSSGELFGSGLLLQLGEPAGGITAYRWVQTDGPTVVLNNPNGARASFTAPNPGGDLYTLTFDLTATGSSDMQATDSVEVTVIGTNEPPVADAGADSNVPLSTDEVTLSGTGSFDPDSGIAGYFWEQESGRPVVLQASSSVTPGFDVPSSVVAGEQMTFKLTVTDRGGLESSDTVEVRFYQDNIYPVADAGEEITAVAEQTVSLDGSGSTDPDGGITAYLWLQIAGTSVTLFNANTAKPFFVAPTVAGSGETLTFGLGVEDTGGLTDIDVLSVRINGTTIADSGEDQIVSAGDPVTLDGGGSVDLDASAGVDIENNIIQSDNSDAGLVSVTAVEGAKYGLRITGNNIGFTEAAGYAVYLFDWPEESPPLEMPNNWWGSDDSAVITELIYDQVDDLRLPLVNFHPFAAQTIEDAGSELTYPPFADAGPDLETTVDLSVTLDGSNSFDPEGIGVYQWQQMEGTTVTLKNSQHPIATFVAPAGGTDGQVLRFRLTISTGGAFSHTDDIFVNVNPDETVPLVEVGGGCFIRSATFRFTEISTIMSVTIIGLLLSMLFSRKRIAVVSACIVALLISFPPAANAGFFAVGGGDGGDADQYNITLETGAKDIPMGNTELMFAFGIPFIPHGDENLPENTIALPCPNDDCKPVGEVRKGTEVGFYGKLGIELGSTNLYLNAIGGFTVYTESQLVRSAGSGATYEQSSDTTIEPLYGAGLSYFTEVWDWPLLIQIDYDVTRGVTGTIGWYW